MVCLKASATGSLLAGPAYVSSDVGLAEPPTGAKAPPLPDRLDAETCSGCASENVPLISLPVLVELGSDTDSTPLPAVEITFAVVDAVYSKAIPGVKGPNEAGAPSDSASVAGTVPRTSPVASSAATRGSWDWTASWLPLMSTDIHLIVWAPRALSVSTSPGRRGPWLR